MLHGQYICAIIPARNEAGAIGQVVTALCRLAGPHNQALIDDLIVCDNGSSDNTALIARAAGARLVEQPQPGYGIACLSAMAALSEQTDIVLFVDGDASCDPAQAERLCQALIDGADLAIGSRKLGNIAPGAMTHPQRFGNALACWLLRRLFQQTVTDLGPYRAIRRHTLEALAMADQRYGWTAEMQTKALARRYRVVEVAVDCLPRIGVSKISGTLAGVLGAGKGILSTIFRVWWQHRRAHATAPANAEKTVREPV